MRPPSSANDIVEIYKALVEDMSNVVKLMKSSPLSKDDVKTFRKANNVMMDMLVDIKKVYGILNKIDRKGGDKAMATMTGVYTSFAEVHKTVVTVVEGMEQLKYRRIKKAVKKLVNGVNYIISSVNDLMNKELLKTFIHVKKIHFILLSTCDIANTLALIKANLDELGPLFIPLLQLKFKGLKYFVTGLLETISIVNEAQIKDLMQARLKTIIMVTIFLNLITVQTSLSQMEGMIFFLRKRLAAKQFGKLIHSLIAELQDVEISEFIQAYTKYKLVVMITDKVIAINNLLIFLPSALKLRFTRRKVNILIKIFKDLWYNLIDIEVKHFAILYLKFMMLQKVFDTLVIISEQLNLLPSKRFYRRTKKKIDKFIDITTNIYNAFKEYEIKEIVLDSFKMYLIGGIFERMVEASERLKGMPIIIRIKIMRMKALMIVDTFHSILEAMHPFSVQEVRQARRKMSILKKVLIRLKLTAEELNDLPGIVKLLIARIRVNLLMKVYNKVFTEMSKMTLEESKELLKKAFMMELVFGRLNKIARRISLVGILGVLIVPATLIYYGILKLLFYIADEVNKHTDSVKSSLQTFGILSLLTLGFLAIVGLFAVAAVQLSKYGKAIQTGLISFGEIVLGVMTVTVLLKLIARMDEGKDLKDSLISKGLSLLDLVAAGLVAFLGIGIGKACAELGGYGNTVLKGMLYFSLLVGSTMLIMIGLKAIAAMEKGTPTKDTLVAKGIEMLSLVSTALVVFISMGMGKASMELASYGPKVLLGLLYFNMTVVSTMGIMLALRAIAAMEKEKPVKETLVAKGIELLSLVSTALTTFISIGIGKASMEMNDYGPKILLGLLYFDMTVASTMGIMLALKAIAAMEEGKEVKETLVARGIEMFSLVSVGLTAFISVGIGKVAMEMNDYGPKILLGLLYFDMTVASTMGIMLALRHIAQVEGDKDVKSTFVAKGIAMLDLVSAGLTAFIAVGVGKASMEMNDYGPKILLGLLYFNITIASTMGVMIALRHIAQIEGDKDVKDTLVAKGIGMLDLVSAGLAAFIGAGIGKSAMEMGAFGPKILAGLLYFNLTILSVIGIMKVLRKIAMTEGDKAVKDTLVAKGLAILDLVSTSLVIFIGQGIAKMSADMATRGKQIVLGLLVTAIALGELILIIKIVQKLGQELKQGFTLESLVLLGKFVILLVPTVIILSLTAVIAGPIALVGAVGLAAIALFLGATFLLMRFIGSPMNPMMDKKLALEIQKSILRMTLATLSMLPMIAAVAIMAVIAAPNFVLIMAGLGVMALVTATLFLLLAAIGIVGIAVKAFWKEFLVGVAAMIACSLALLGVAAILAKTSEIAQGIELKQILKVVAGAAMVIGLMTVLGAILILGWPILIAMAVGLLVSILVVEGIYKLALKLKSITDLDININDVTSRIESLIGCVTMIVDKVNDIKFGKMIEANFKLWQMTRMVVHIARMAKILSKMASLKIPTEFDRHGRPLGYAVMKAQDFKNAALNGIGIVTTIVAMFDDVTTKVVYADGSFTVNGMRTEEFDVITNKIKRKFRQLNKMVKFMGRMADTLKDMSSLKIPIGFDEKGKATGWTKMGKKDFQDAALNGLGIVQTILAVFQDEKTVVKTADGEFTVTGMNTVALNEITTKTKRKFRQLNKMVKFMGRMAETLTDISSLKVPIAYDEEGKPLGYAKMTAEDFNSAAVNSVAMTKIFTAIFGDKEFVVKTSESSITVKPITEAELNNITNKTKRKFRQLNKIVGFIGNMTETVLKVASMSNPVAWDEEGKPIQFEKLSTDDFVKAAQNVALIVTTVSSAIFSSIKDNDLENMKVKSAKKMKKIMEVGFGGMTDIINTVIEMSKNQIPMLNLEEKDGVMVAQTDEQGNPKMKYVSLKDLDVDGAVNNIHKIITTFMDKMAAIMDNKSNKKKPGNLEFLNSFGSLTSMVDIIQKLGEGRVGILDIDEKTQQARKDKDGNPIMKYVLLSKLDTKDTITQLSTKVTDIITSLGSVFGENSEAVKSAGKLSNVFKTFNLSLVLNPMIDIVEKLTKVKLPAQGKTETKSIGCRVAEITADIINTLAPLSEPMNTLFGPLTKIIVPLKSAMNIQVPKNTKGVVSTVKSITDAYKYVLAGDGTNNGLTAYTTEMDDLVVSLAKFVPVFKMFMNVDGVSKTSKNIEKITPNIVSAYTSILDGLSPYESDMKKLSISLYAYVPASKLLFNIDKLPKNDKNITTIVESIVAAHMMIITSFADKTAAMNKIAVPFAKYLASTKLMFNLQVPKDVRGIASSAIKIADVHIQVIDAFRRRTVSMSNIASSMPRYLLAVSALFNTNKNPRGKDGIPSIKELVNAHVYIIDQFSERVELINDIYVPMTKYFQASRLLFEINASGNTADNIDRASKSTIGLLDKVNSINGTKLEKMVSLSENMATFATSIKGDFNGLAKAMNENIITALDKVDKALKELKDYLETLPDQLSTSVGNAISSAEIKVTGTDTDTSAADKTKKPQADKGVDKKERPKPDKIDSMSELISALGECITPDGRIKITSSR